MDIGSVDGIIVSPSNDKAKELAIALGRLPTPVRPTEIGSPWELDGPEYFTDGDHQDHLHVGFDDPAVAGDEALAARLEALGTTAAAAKPAAPRPSRASRPATLRRRTTAKVPRDPLRRGG